MHKVVYIAAPPPPNCRVSDSSSVKRKEWLRVKERVSPGGRKRPQLTELVPTARHSLVRKPTEPRATRCCLCLPEVSAPGTQRRPRLRLCSLGSTPPLAKPQAAALRAPHGGRRSGDLALSTTHALRPCTTGTGCPASTLCTGLERKSGSDTHCLSRSPCWPRRLQRKRRVRGTLGNTVPASVRGASWVMGVGPP